MVLRLLPAELKKWIMTSVLASLPASAGSRTTAVYDNANRLQWSMFPIQRINMEIGK